MDNQGQFEHRADTLIITLADVIEEFSEPERLRLQLPTKVLKKPFDIGSWTYAIKGKNEKVHDDRGNPVVIESFVESRRELVVRILASFVGQRPYTVHSRLLHTQYFIDWLNTQGYREVFATAVSAQKAYRDFTARLNHLLFNQKLKPISARNCQYQAFKLIELLYPEDHHHILAGAVRITAEKGSEAASNAHFELYRDVCLAIAEQCGAFVLGNKPYPFVVTVRDYETVLFPSQKGWVGPFKASAHSYNAFERRLSTVEEYWASCDELGRRRPRKSLVVKDLAVAQIRLDAANENERHWHRRQIAGLAAKAYASLIVMITGATPTEVDQFCFADALAVEKSPIKKELTAVKFRAGGKGTLYNIGRGTGLRVLKEYLKLREWILNDVEHERLFFTMPSNAGNAGDIGKFPDFNVTQALFGFFDSISGTFLDPKVPRLSPRKMRKHKSIGMHTVGIPLPTVAASLNHSEEVNLSTYADASLEQQETEFGKFWQAVRYAANVVRERSQGPAEGQISTAAGHCNGFRQPLPVRDLGAIAIEPNCRSQYGCLYCEHYVCHSDEEDVHKLLSLQYVIDAVRKTAPDAAHAEALYKELSVRIEFILEALSKKSDAVKRTVEAVKDKVFKYGVLTTFWENRLNRYEKMGVIF